MESEHFDWGTGTGLRLALCLIASIGLMALDRHRPDTIRAFRSGLATVVYPLQAVVGAPSLVSRWVKEQVVDRKHLLAENAKLREANLVLRSRLQKFNMVVSDNQRLRTLLDSSQEFGERVLLADLLPVQLDLSTQQVLINKGAQHGVYQGQPIIDAHGIVGQVTQVNALSATVLLLTDPSHSVPVQVDRSGQRAIAVGTGTDDSLELVYVPTHGDVRVGDTLVSSGLGGSFPPGYQVGRVTQVQTRPGQPFVSVRVQPAARLRDAREVLLLWPGGPSDPRPASQGRFALSSPHPVPLR